MAKRLTYTEDSGKWTSTLSRFGDGPISSNPSLYRHWPNFKGRFDLIRLNQNPRRRLSIAYKPVETESNLSFMFMLKTITSFMRGVRMIVRICSGVKVSVTHSWIGCLRRLLDLTKSKNGVSIGSILADGSDIGTIIISSGCESQWLND